MNKTTSILIAVIIISGIGYWYFRQNTNSNQTATGLTEAQAKAIAETTCIKGGESLELGTYNANTKTWWFDTNLNTKQDGCNPACVVSEETKTAEINWRCTGLIMPGASVSDTLQQLFAEKYPKYAQTLSINIEAESSDYVRGSINFESGQAGGIFLATKINEQWQIVHDGNGAIPCTLSQYGFPAEMLNDCSQ